MKKLLYLILLISTGAFAQSDPAPTTPISATLQGFYKIVAGDTIHYSYQSGGGWLKIAGRSWADKRYLKISDSSTKYITPYYFHAHGSDSLANALKTLGQTINGKWHFLDSVYASQVNVTNNVTAANFTINGAGNFGVSNGTLSTGQEAGGFVANTVADPSGYTDYALNLITFNKVGSGSHQQFIHPTATNIASNSDVFLPNDVGTVLLASQAWVTANFTGTGVTDTTSTAGAKGRTQANTQFSQLATRATADEVNIASNTSAISGLPTKNATYQLNGLPYINSSGELQSDTSYMNYNPSTNQFKYHAGTTGTNVQFKIGSGLTTDFHNILGISDNTTVGAGDVASAINAEGRYTMTANSLAGDRYRGGKFVSLVDPGGFTSTGIGTGVLGAEGVSRITGSGTINVASGLYGRVLVDASGGIVTTANSFLAPVPVVVSGGSVVNAIGYNAPDQAGTRITNSFNYVSGGDSNFNGGEAPSDGATGTWSFYGYSTAPNFLRGKTGIGPGMGVSTSNISAYLHLGAGTATAGTAPLKFTSGTHLTTGEDGAVNYDGTNLTLDVSTTKNTFLTDLNTIAGIQNKTFSTGSVWNGGVIPGLYGGTGVANSGKTITLAGNFQLFGGFNATLTVTGSTNVTLPTSGTLAVLASPAFTGSPTAPTQTTGINNTTVATTAYVSNVIAVTASFTDQTTTPVTLSNSVTSGNYAWNANSASQVVFTLPAASVKGATYEICGVGAGGWKIAQNAGDQIKGSGISTTAGTGGSIAGVQYTTIRIRCYSANTGSGGLYIVEFVNGTPTVI